MYTSDHSGNQNTVYLKNYRPPAFLIKNTDLRIELDETGTEVVGELEVVRNTQADAPADPHLVLHMEQMELLDCELDGASLEEGQGLRLEEGSLAVLEVPDQFRLRTRVRIHPEKNTSLMGLYKSRTMFCTQCEAEGFRKITPYLDRPDVLSRFRTTLVARKDLYPVLLSNGNLVREEDLGEGLHSATWEDPFPKPSYLFAMVAGNLSRIDDSYTTASGRQVELRIYVEDKDLDKCDHALRSLKKAMRWDEEVFGREYDLDIFMIVAVDDFNMGAMENKGLNIFNTSAVLTNPAITTDQRFQWVEAVVAHEYFHNWSGNRVTCRDWFQLSLKEGFTVYRDSEFSADMNSPTVKRIEDVRTLRAYQFAEDAGPLAHPVQPPAYQEINNFYTQTVYEKGAEVVRMQACLLGPEDFRRATDLYFERFDGQAVTIEDFVGCMAEVSGRDFSQFMRWYQQAGTPVVEVQDEFEAASGTYRLHFSQTCPPTPEQQEKLPFVIPIRLGLVGDSGDEALYSNNPAAEGETETLFELTEPHQSISFSGLKEKPIPSLLRDFSAPVKLRYSYTEDQLVGLIQRDSNGFNRWNAAQEFAILMLEKMQQQLRGSIEPRLDQRYTDSLQQLLTDKQLDPAMVAMMTLLPSMETLIEGRKDIDLDLVWQARETARNQIAARLADCFRERYQELSQPESYAPSADQIARRSLKNICLGYWLAAGDAAALDAAREQFNRGDNMTDVSAALLAMANSTVAGAEQAADESLAAFYERWQHEPLAVNQWLAIQAGRQVAGNLERVKTLLQHPSYSETNPNKVRALIGGFCTLNPENFHNQDGSGYQFLAEQVLRLNKINPQVAARLVTPLTKWKNYSAARSGLMRENLSYIAAQTNLSKDLREIVDKSLQPG